MPQTERILTQFADQARACEALGSPFTARLCRLLAARLDARTRFGHSILGWPRDPYADNIALRAAGAMHALARSGWEPGLAAVYPPQAASDQALWAAIADALAHNDVFLTERLASAPQTNEVARSGLILGGLLHVAAITGQPLELYEIGASAGLNLGVDAYRYDLGEGRAWGAADAPLTITCPWRGTPPPLATPLRIAGRRGCDLNPLDPARPEDRARLLSYIWADQTERLQRIEAALGLAAAARRAIARADAADWLEAQLTTPQPAGTTRVVFHTIVWQYIPAPQQARISALLARLGAEVTVERPLVRLAIEADATPGSAGIALTLWPTGETLALGRGDFHGRWADWT